MTTRPAGQTEVQVLQGTFGGRRIEPRPLVDGQLDLSLEEGAELEAGGLTLNGAEVELMSSDRERAGLKSCRQALEALDPQTPNARSEPAIERKLTQGFDCRRAGWDFAELVITRLLR